MTRGLFLSNELRVLLLASREQPSSHVLDEMASLIWTLNPDRFISLARAHKTFPLVHSTLGLLPDFYTNASFLEIVRSISQITLSWTTRRSRLLASETKLRDILLDSQIPFAFIRGPELARRIYNHPAARFSSDLDVLVEFHEVRKALRVLSLAGFEYVESKHKRNARADYLNQVELRDSINGVRCDLNWNFAGNGGIGCLFSDIDGVWQRCRQKSGSEYHLSASDEFFELIRHVTQGHDFRHGILLTCSDIANYVRKYTIDWELVSALAQRTECRRAVDFFLYFFQHIYMANVVHGSSNGIQLLDTHASRKEIEFRLFTQTVIIPNLILPSIARSPIDGIIGTHIGITGKFWSLDKISRVFGLIRTVYFPKKAEFLLLTCDEPSLVVRIIHHYSRALSALFSILLGSIALVFFLTERRARSLGNEKADRLFASIKSLFYQHKRRH